MQATVTNYIYDKVKELMAHVGLSDDTINRYDAFIISAIVIIIAIAVMEISYRVSLFVTKRILNFPSRALTFLCFAVK